MNIFPLIEVMRYFLQSFVCFVGFIFALILTPPLRLTMGTETIRESLTIYILMIKAQLFLMMTQIVFSYSSSCEKIQKKDFPNVSLNKKKAFTNIRENSTKEI